MPRLALGRSRSWHSHYSYSPAAFGRPTPDRVRSYSALTGDSPTNDIPPSHASKAIILYPRLSNWAADHPEYNPFTLLDPIPGPPVYWQTNPSLEELLTKLEISKE